MRSGGDSARAGAHQRAKTGPDDACVMSAALAKSRARRRAGARATGGRLRPFFRIDARTSLWSAPRRTGAPAASARETQSARNSAHVALWTTPPRWQTLARCGAPRDARAVSQQPLNSPILIASRRLRSASLAAAPRVHARAATRETRTPCARARVWHAPRVARALARRRGRGDGAMTMRSRASFLRH